MLNRNLIEFYKSPNNGKQIATLPDGRRLLLVHSELMGPAAISLYRSRDSAPRSLAEFEHLQQLVGPEADAPQAGPWGFGGSLLLHEDVLHVAWTGAHGLQSCRLDNVGGNPRTTRCETILEGDCRLGDLLIHGGTIVAGYHRVHDRQTESVGLVWRENGGRRSQEVYRGSPIFPPVVETDPDGAIHLVFAEVAERLHHVRLEKPGAAPTRENVGDGIEPGIIATDDGLLIACLDSLSHLQYYRRGDDGWRKEGRLTIGHPWLTGDLLHSPQFARDRHGVVWLFFADNTRCSTFWFRWLGNGFAEVTNGPRLFHRPPRFEDNLLPIGRLSVEKHTPEHAGAIGLLIHARPPAQRIEFCRETVPGLDPSSARKTLFLDMLEVARTRGVRQEVETAAKHPENPLMETGPSGSFDEDRVFNHGNVVHDGKRYRMWYTGVRTPRPGEPGVPWWDTIRGGYAESEDGIHWQRVTLGLVEWNGSTENNIVPFLRHSAVVMHDPADPDPRRRYKAFYFWNSGEHLQIARTGKYGKSYDPRDEKFLVDFLPSEDGLHLRRIEGETRFPGEQVKPYSAIPQCVFRDDDEPDPRKRYKAYGFMSLNLRRRGTCYLHSPDGLRWTAHPEMPVIDPAVSGIPPVAGGPTSQVHDTVCLPYEGYYVALFQDQVEPRNMPVELAVSRDGEHFRHVKRGSRVIPLGPPEAFDALAVRPSMPVVREGEIRIYYGGGSERKLESGQTIHTAQPGLATLRRDGFTSLRLDSGRKSGFVETVPFQLDRPAALHVNTVCPDGSRLRVELRDAATGRPIPDYSADECAPMTGDRLDAAVHWRNAKRLPKADKPVRLRFELLGNEESVRLYAFRFVTG